MLELENISFSVRENGRTKNILKNINLKIEDDKFLVVTGPNGSGKSTLAKIIMGINKPSSGRIIFNGKDITNLSISERAKLGISFAFQQPVKFKGITVKQMISLAAGKDISIVDACKYLSDVGLCARDYIDRDIDGSLSGGELKRIEIATTVARSSKLTIFDEPEAGIDLWSFNSLIKVFEKMAEQTKRTTIIISHQERIINFADKVLLVNNGQIEKQGRPEDVISGISVSRICKVMESKDVK